MSYTETEIKFHIADLDKLAAHLEALGAIQISPRTYEMNLRFDTPAGTLSAQACVLRLRRDAESRLTFKGPTFGQDGIAQREEIEFAVGDFDAAKRFLEALGYELVATYEKYRITYKLDELYIMLDEMPYGNFIEIEGEDFDDIRHAAEKLSLRWDAAVNMSYLAIFSYLQTKELIFASELTFDAFRSESADLALIGILSAD